MAGATPKDGPSAGVAMTRKPEPIEWDETTTTAAAVPEEVPVEEETSTLTAH